MFRPDRSSGRSVRWLEWRIRLFGSGAILALFGIGADVALLRWAALAVLAGAAGLSIAAGRTDAAGDEDEEPEDV